MSHADKPRKLNSRERAIWLHGLDAGLRAAFAAVAAAHRANFEHRAVHESLGSGDITKVPDVWPPPHAEKGAR